MSRLIAYAALLLAALIAVPAQAQENWAGDWNGTLTTPNGPLRLLLTISQGADGALTAELESLDQAPGRKIPVATVAIESGRLTFAIPAIRATYEGTWEAGTERFTGTFNQGAAMPLSLERGAGAARPVVTGLDGVWRGTVNRGGVDLRLIVTIATNAHGTTASLDSPDLMANILPVTGLARDGRTVSFTVPASGVVYRGALDEQGGRMSGIWARPGSPDATVAFVRSAPAAAAAAPRLRPQTPQPPFPYRAEEVAFDNARAPGVRLAGTLTLPPGPGRFPAAILISGSGAQDRDESIWGHKPFAVLADHLTRQGIAVLRYDDRGVAASTGTQDGATSADFAADARAALAYLRTRPEIAPRAIGLVGHSEGGLIGPLAAVEDEGVAYLVLLAGPGTSTRTLMESQRRAIGTAQGQTPAELDRSAALYDLLASVAASGRSAAEAEAAMRAALTDEAMTAAALPLAQRDAVIRRSLDPWFRYFAAYDPAPVLARVRVPILALNGSLDRQILATENLAGIRAATAANRDVTIAELPGLNHLFQTAQTGALGEYADIEESVAPAALDMVSRWILARFGPR